MLAVFPENGLRHENRGNTFPANGDKAKEPREEEGTWKCYIKVNKSNVVFHFSVLLLTMLCVITGVEMHKNLL